MLGGQRNDESQRAHKSSQIHTWHGNWVRLGPDLQYKHIVAIWQWLLNDVKKGTKRREEVKKREDYQSWLWHDSAVQGAGLHMQSKHPGLCGGTCL